MPSVTENRKRPKEEFDVKGKETNCRLCLLVLAIVIVAISGLAIGIVLVRTLQSSTNESTNADKINLTSPDATKWTRIWEDICMYSVYLYV